MTSASESATASGTSARRRRAAVESGRRPKGGRILRARLPGQHEDAAHPEPSSAGDVLGRVVPDHRHVARGKAAAEIGGQARQRSPEHDRAGLAADQRPDTGRELQRGNEGAAVERRAPSREPPRVPVHGEERGAAADQAERAVHVREAQVRIAIADHDRSDPGTRLVRGFVGHEVLPLELPPAVGPRDHEQGLALEPRRRIGGGGAGRRHDPLFGDRQAGGLEPSRQGAPMGRREVGGDPERDSAREQRRQRRAGPREVPALHDQHAVRVQHEAPHAGEDRPQHGGFRVGGGAARVHRRDTTASRASRHGRRAAPGRGGTAVGTRWWRG